MGGGLRPVGGLKRGLKLCEMPTVELSIRLINLSEMPVEAPSESALTEHRARRPGRPRRDETNGAELRSALLDAATELAVERGFDKVGLREIADRAGASPAMISYYFGDRDGLYIAMFTRVFDRVTEQVLELLDPDSETEASVENLVRVHVTAISRNVWVPQLIAREVLARDTPLRKHFDEKAGGPIEMMIAWIEREKERGLLRADLDAELTAMSIAGLSVFPYLFGPILKRNAHLGFDEEFRDRLIAHNQKLIAHGIRARTENRT